MVCDYMKLQLSGKPYPRTCPTCGLGPCKYPEPKMTAPAKPTIDEQILQILQNQLAACQKECKEQARLNGMGSEREARLMAQLAELQDRLNRMEALIAANLTDFTQGDKR